MALRGAVEEQAFILVRLRKYWDIKETRIVRVFILSMGCAKNRVDSECLAGELIKAGHEVVENIEDAQAAVINTCGFIRPAVEENISAILELEELKQKGGIKKIGVVGCLYNRYGQELSQGFETVDFWAESEAWSTVVAELGKRENIENSCHCRVRANLPGCQNFSRYLKISEGCNNRCSYCAIPLIRGNLRSLPVEIIVNEAIKLTEEGARELCVVGQDLTAYGMDFNNGKPKLLELLNALETNLPDSVKLRLLYLHPERITVELLEKVAESKKILNYLDIPIQHADEKILVAMNRGIKRDKLFEIFTYARSLDPYFALRTTCMVGFPGEKHKNVKNLLEFLEEVQFDRVGAFTYFAEEGTKAANLPMQLTDNTKQKWLAELMAIQEEISFERQRLFIGKTLNVLVERVENGYAEGRSYREAPEVDGIIEIKLAANSKLSPGDVIMAKVTDASVHDLVAEEVY